MRPMAESQTPPALSESPDITGLIRLRIAPDGCVRGLWTDEVDWAALGSVSVRRASHVEFDPTRQCWTVISAHTRFTARQFCQRLLRRPLGRVLYRAARRADALRWEHSHFGPGGPAWPQVAGTASTRALADKSERKRGSE